MVSTVNEHVDPLVNNAGLADQTQGRHPRTITNNVYRRSRVQTLLTSLIRFTILVVIPIAFGNLTRLLIDHFSYSDGGNRNEMLNYFQNMNVLVPLGKDLAGLDNLDFQSNYRLIYIGGDRDSLIAKYHNILVYFTSKIIKPYVMDEKDTYIKSIILSCYSKGIKTITAILVLISTLVSTLYLWFALLFFCVCIVFNFSIKIKSFTNMIASLL